MKNATRFQILLVATCLLLPFANYGFAAEGVTVLDQNIKATPISSGRFYKIVWQVKLRNDTREAQTCRVTLSLLDGKDKVIGEAAKTKVLAAREEKRVSGVVQLRASITHQIANYGVSVQLE